MAVLRSARTQPLVAHTHHVVVEGREDVAAVGARREAIGLEGAAHGAPAREAARREVDEVQALPVIDQRTRAAEQQRDAVDAHAWPADGGEDPAGCVPDLVPRVGVGDADAPAPVGVEGLEHQVATGIDDPTCRGH